MAEAKDQKIAFGAGCFWGVQKYFSSLKGVKQTRVGYTGGNYSNPNYDKVLAYRYQTPDGIKNHTEAVEIIYDDSIISTEKLIKKFWEIHDPTQYNRQGNDIGNNYRSAIFYTTKEQKEIAQKTKNEYQELLSGAGFGKIVTEIEPLDNFYEAEEYHQNYLKKHPNGYCPNHSTGIKFEEKGEQKDTKIVTPFGGKEIVVVESLNCPYCQKLKNQTLKDYKGSIPLRFAMENQLDKFTIKSPIRVSPTILLIEDGKELARIEGFITKEQFYKLVGIFKLGEDSQAFNIAFNQGTENRFCKKYDKFKHTPDGVFVDILSGKPLFDTKDRFNSGSGWLSFYQAVDGAVEERDDFSFGMHRIEVISKSSGIHLGHVFDDAPDGKRRYCINANILEFVPRDELKASQKEDKK
jgi:peptide methionine sulfoxide reductase msrA/msrB